MNAVLVVIDSLRACSLGCNQPGAPRTPFLDRLAGETITFRAARATECWTLPTHMSMFTGLLPSAHGAHFQTMAYERSAPTIAELLASAGHRTEVVTRNSIFDGTLPGATRGFGTNTKLLADLRTAHLFGLFVALSKPRIRRLIRTSGFFHVLQRENRDFLTTLARMIVPADRRVLGYALDTMAALRRQGAPYFLFLNLYDVHAPYAPTADSPLRPFRTLDGCIENLMLPWVATRLGSHAYLRPGFRFRPRTRRALLARYHRAIELMDAKLGEFYDAARGARLLDDTLLVIASDHGEAFGEHALWFHDASVYDTHLRVPLWIHHPERAPEVVDDVVSTAAVFTLLRNVALGQGLCGTLLDADARAAIPVALAEHFHYPHVPGALERYRHDVAAAVVGRRKAIVGPDGITCYDLVNDPDETSPEAGSIEGFAATCRLDGAPARAIAAATDHLRRWHATAAAA